MIKKLSVANSKGLHGRPATVLVETASKFSGAVSISFGAKKVNCKSLIAIMSLAVPCGGEVAIELEGDGEASAMSEIETVIGTDYEG